MERDRSSKVIAIVALLVAVVGVSVGFVALGRDLTITSEANVSPENNLIVLFSSDDAEQKTEPVVGKVIDSTITEGETSAATAENASISGTTISNLEANFTKPGQTVTYEFYAHNAGSFAAYLTDIMFEDAATEKKKVCTPATGTTAEYANNACEDIKIEVSVGEGSSLEEATTTVPGIAGHELGMNSFEKVVVTISYPTGSDVADGDFSVKFGDITLRYSSIDSE